MDDQMVERYAADEMKRLWSAEAKYAAWLEAEKAGVRAWNKLGLISDGDCEKICANAKFNVARIDKIEKTTKHDMIAFLTSVSESLGVESRFVHYAMTSSDTIDTANALLMRDSLKIVIKDAEALARAIKTRAIEHKSTLTIGRSHGVHGEPITFGLTLAIWYEELRRHIENLRQTLKVVAVGKFSGAMGSFAHAPIEFEELACGFLDLECARVSNQIIQRDRYARLACALALLASSIEKFALQVRHWQRTEVYEAEEYFSEGQKGSSAMPHKRNPVLSENVCGLARIVRSFAIPAMESVALWHERDISHSSAERFWLADSFITIDFMLRRFTGVISKLLIYPQNMMKNLELTGGLAFSQRVLLELPKAGLSREAAYAIAQRNAMKVWKALQEGKAAKNERGESLYLQYLLQEGELVSAIGEAKIRECFDYDYYLRNIDAIFKRVFE